jgi:Zn finger protein HypA/HybF involved in hydrogenase expression
MPIPPRPEGTTCEQCGTFSPFPAYVFAHWTILLTFTCPTCGQKYEVFEGESVPLQENSHARPSSKSR